MRMVWKAMGGIMPRIEPHLLPDMTAQVARNAKLWTGGVDPLKGEVFVALTYKVGEKQTIFRDGQHLDDETKYWFSFNGDVDITRGPILDDAIGRLYYTGDGVPKLTNSGLAWADPGAMPVSFQILGIPAPTAATVGVTGTPDVDSLPVTILASYAFVTSDGFVGPPAPVSAAIVIYPGQTLTVSDMDPPPNGAYSIDRKYVYVAQTDSSGATALRLWHDEAWTTTSTSGEVDFTILGEEVDSPSLIAPPTSMFGIGLHPNGFLFGFTTRKFLRSEVFKPHGWPDVYQDPIGDDIVGGACIGQQIIICTRGKTYSAIGSDPMNMSIQDLSGMQPCAAKRSIKAMPFGVLYAGADGLVLAGGMNPLTVVTEAYFTRAQWQAYNPSSMHAAVHDRRYYCFWHHATDVAQRGCLIFEFLPTGGIHQIVQSSLHFTATFTDGRRDQLYVAKQSDGEIYRWDAGENLTSLWRSRMIRLPRAENVGAVRIYADEYPITFRLYDENELVSEVEVMSNRPERLDGRRRYEQIHWEVEATAKWTQVEVGSSIADLIANG